MNKLLENVLENAYGAFTTLKGTIFGAQDEGTPEDVTGDDTGEDTGDTGDDASHSDTGDEQASIITQTESQPTDR